MLKKVSTDCLNHVIEIIFIQSGQVRNYIAKVMIKKNSAESFVRTWNLFMIQPEDRGMKSGTEDKQIRSLMNNRKLLVWSMK